MLALATLLSSAILTLSLTTAPSADMGPCTGTPPSAGTIIRGPVLHVLDGATLCVALGANPDRWVPLALAGARTQSIAAGSAARGTLMGVAFAQDVTCEILGASHGLTIADCRVDDRRISERLNEPDAIRVGLSWR